MIDSLVEIEELTWAMYLDMKRQDMSTPRVFDRWKKLWKERNVPVPNGAWETP